jgi:hypothetical protein
MSVEGLEASLEERYVILRDGSLKETYPAAKEVARILDNSIRNNTGNILGVFRILGVNDLGEYLEKLRDRDERVVKHYSAIARVM